MALEPHIIKAFCERNEMAAKIVHDHFFKMLFGYALPLTGDANVSRELVNDAVVKCWVKGQFNDYQHLRATMYLCINQGVADFIKERRRRREAEADAPLITYSERMNALTISSAMEMLQDKVKKGMSPVHAKIFHLKFVQGFQHSEIAEELQLSLRTVDNKSSQLQMFLRALYRVKVLFIWYLP